MSLMFSIIYAGWFLSEVIFNRLLRSKNNQAVSKDKGTIKLIWVLIFIAIFLGVYASNFNFPLTNNNEIKYIGLALICIGVLFRIIIILSLGKYFTVNVAIHQNHKLKKDGFYTFVRHPSYAASLVSFVGFGIALNNWVSLLIVICFILIAFLIRINFEEKALIHYFGSDYLNYKGKTKRIIPFIY